MRCGNCKGDHPTVAAVRECYASDGKIAVKDRPEGDTSDFRARMEAQVHTRPATPRMVAFIERLILEKFPENKQAAAKTRYLTDGKKKGSGLSFDNAKANIDELMAMKTVQAGPTSHFPPPETLPSGHYAIPTKEGARNKLAFYRVDRPKDGRWAGFCFIKHIVGGHPESNVPRAQAASVAAAIVKAGVEESALLYGREIGRCCVCNRTLTNDESRAKGIGPICEGAGGGFF